MSEELCSSIGFLAFPFLFSTKKLLTFYIEIVPIKEIFNLVCVCAAWDISIVLFGWFTLNIWFEWISLWSHIHQRHEYTHYLSETLTHLRLAHVNFMFNSIKPEQAEKLKGLFRRSLVSSVFSRNFIKAQFCWDEGLPGSLYNERGRETFQLTEFQLITTSLLLYTLWGRFWWDLFVIHLKCGH